MTGSLLVILFGGAYIFSSCFFSLLLLTVALIIICDEWPKLIDVTCWQHWILSLIYPIAPLTGLIVLNYVYHDTAPLIPIYPFCIAWIADTCGYVIGKCFGKTKICPRISPGKTSEGFWGGYCGIHFFHTFMIDKLFFLPHFIYETNPCLYTFSLIGFSLTMTIIAFLGGLYLSWLKRRKQVKDAGWILPGHGGLLDRFDGVLAVTLLLMILMVLHVLQ